MKVIFQTFVIFAVAALIGSAIFAAVNMGGNATQTRERAFDENRPARPEGGHEENHEGGMMLPFGMVKSLVIISVIGAPYFILTKRNPKKQSISVG